MFHHQFLASKVRSKLVGFRELSAIVVSLKYRSKYAQSTLKMSLKIRGSQNHEDNIPFKVTSVILRRPVIH